VVVVGRVVVVGVTVVVLVFVGELAGVVDSDRVQPAASATHPSATPAVMISRRIPVSLAGADGRPPSGVP
jgi:hypothetical protein